MSEEELVLQHLPQVHIIAKKIRQRFRHADFDDLVGYGTLGLMKAIKAFDASRGILLKTYAEYRIRGEILDGLRGMNWLSRSACRRKAQYRKSASQNGEACGGGVPHAGETALRPSGKRPAAPSRRPPPRLEIPLLEIHCAGSQLENLDQIAQSTGRSMAAATDQNPVAIYYRKQLARQVAQAVARLPRRDRYVLEMHYQRELSLKQIGVLLNVHQSRVSQLHAGAIRQLRDCFRDAEKPRAEAKALLSGCEAGAQNIA